MKTFLNGLVFKITQICTMAMRRLFDPITYRLRQILKLNKPINEHGFESWARNETAQTHPRVLHIIANFMLGGSSRLVMDIVENTSDAYAHWVVTSCLPSPSVYSGVGVTEFRSPSSPEEVLPFLLQYNPTIVHVHYWGDCDFWWYDIFFKAVKNLNCRVIENINTPVEPYQAGFIDKYVHVSKYVENKFGNGSSNNMTIYPGSDFSVFSRSETFPFPKNWIGMVYRLENDKLNQNSIDVFIKVVQQRPLTQVLIVGGGTNLEIYRNAVHKAGIQDNFEFTGYVDYNKLRGLYERMSIFVAPVWKESFGQVSPFAMNMKIPVVGYNVGGVTEIVQDSSLLAEPENSDQLAEIVIRLLDAPNLGEQIGLQNYVRAQALFSIEAMVNSYRKLYADLTTLEK